MTKDEEKRFSKLQESNNEYFYLFEKYSIKCSNLEEKLAKSETRNKELQSKLDDLSKEMIDKLVYKALLNSSLQILHMLEKINKIGD